MTRTQRNNYNTNVLAELRGIIRGWAFADQHGKELRLNQAEDWITSQIGPSFVSTHVAAEAIIEPLRLAVENGRTKT